MERRRGSAQTFLSGNARAVLTHESQAVRASGLRSLVRSRLLDSNAGHMDYSGRFWVVILLRLFAGMLPLPLCPKQQGRARLWLQTTDPAISPIHGHASDLPRWNPSWPTCGSEDLMASHGNGMGSIQHASSLCSRYPVCHDFPQTCPTPDHQIHITAPAIVVSCLA